MGLARAFLVPPLLCVAHAVLAQGVTTGAIRGVVRDERARPIADATIRVAHRGTGHVATGRTGEDGRYFVAGLDVGGPYAVTVAHVGGVSQTREDLSLAIGQALRVDFLVAAQTPVLAEIVVRSEPDPGVASASLGPSSRVSDSALRRLPTLNRDVYGFLQLVPQMTTRLGPSGGGVNHRLNSYLIDGASEQAMYSAFPAGGIFGGKSIPLEAVREYQVLLAPFDVRHGSFAGALINAVTRGGTNELHGSASAYLSNERLARDVPFLRASPYERSQMAFSVGGPVVRNRLHFFVAPEFQRRSAPASGPYVGNTGNPPVPADTADIQRFVRILDSWGLEAGSPGPISNTNPLVNLFARLDLALPAWSSRLMVRYNYGHADSGAFSRPTATPLFPLSSTARHSVITKRSVAASLHSTTRGGVSNEVLLGYAMVHARTRPDVIQPLVTVTVPRPGGTGTAQLQAGVLENAQRTSAHNRIVELTDNLSAQRRAHRWTLGAKVTAFQFGRAFVPGAYGVWRFASLDSLHLGQALTYRVTRDLGGASAVVRGVEYAVYAGDEWAPHRRLTVTFGLRADVPVLERGTPYVPAVDSLFGSRTDRIPARRVYWSPRAGFSWDIPGGGRHQLRGGVGTFVGRPQGAWLHNAFAQYGGGLGRLSCGAAPTDAGPAPPFSPDPHSPPPTCANGVGFSGLGPVSLLAPRLQYPQTLRASLEYERRLPWSVVATITLLYTHALSDFLFVNRNLRGPAGVDRRGRVLYGTLDTLGRATPDLIAPAYGEVVELTSTASSRARHLTVRLTRQWANGLEATASYTNARVRDAQTQLFPFAFDNWRGGRPLSGAHDDVRLGVSDHDQAHRVIVTGTYAFPWRWRTEVALSYVGESGLPFTFIADTSTRTGDLNADGTNYNDPLYIPRSATDTAEIRFRGTPAEIATQQAALEDFIQRTPCLRRQRGAILARNSCRGPWVHALHASLRQSLPSWRTHTVTLQMDVFNLLNLVARDWGLLQRPNRLLLTHVSQTAGPPAQSSAVFAFDPAFRAVSVDDPSSYYQIQLALRYSF